MASRRDQLQSYQFLTQRVISAFVMREADPQQSPLRRGIGALFGGVMVAIIVAAVFGIYGIITRVGGDAWRSDGSVVIERETGATFLYAGGELHPTVNYASAMLASGRPHPAIFRVAAAALADVDRGVTIGIPGAPDSLPPADGVIGLPWTLCTAAGDGGVTLLVGGPPQERRVLDETGILVTDPAAGGIYLVWHGHRYQLQPETVVPALFGAIVTPTPVGSSWLNPLPAGVDIGPLPVAGRGQAAAAVAAYAVGDLLVAETGSGPQHYVVLDDGLAAITPLQAAIESAHAAGQATPVPLAEANAQPRSELLDEDEVAPPRTPPGLATLEDAELVCATTRDAADAPEVSVGDATDLLAAANPTRADPEQRSQVVDRVHVPAGRVAVVRAVTVPGVAAGTYHIVTDAGLRHPVPSPEVLPMLGYDAALAVDIPASLVAKLPEGPTLDPEVAARPTGPG